MEKINIAELLKDFPKGIELDCTISHGKVIFQYVELNSNFPIHAITEDGYFLKFTKYGELFPFKHAECVIFPKGKTTWEGFIPPCKFKDGDIVISDKGDIHLLRTKDSSYCAYRKSWGEFPTFDSTLTTCVKVVRLATEEEKQKLFDAIKANGYKWNPDTKTLEKLLKFNEGDIIADKHGNIAIYKGTMWYNKKLAGYYCGYRKFDNCFIPEPKKDGHFGSIEEIRFATEEEKQKLFDIIKANDYRWNLETKTLEKIPELNDGDIVVTEIGSIFIYNKSLDNQDYFGCYVGLSCIKSKTPKIIIMDQFSFKNSNLRLATNAEKVKLFQAIKDNGYYWNEKTKILEKLPKFKVGDRVKHISACTVGIVVKVADKGYHIDYPKGEGICYISFTLEKDYELAPNKFDITTLKPFESRVLVRNYDSDYWKPAIFGFIGKDKNAPFCVEGGNFFNKCIPYEGNEHLLSTREDCNDFYKTW